MKQYNFYDTDPLGYEEYDILGEDYFKLLAVCFSYCDTLSLLFDLRDVKSALLFQDLEEYRLPVTEDIKRLYAHYGVFDGDVLGNYEIRHYRLSNEVKEKIIGVTDSIFKWIYGWGCSNPEDPAFFRKDGSVFFQSLIHEGVCSLFPQDEEKVDHIICGKKWNEVKEN